MGGVIKDEWNEGVGYLRLPNMRRMLRTTFIPNKSPSNIATPLSTIPKMLPNLDAGLGVGANNELKSSFISFALSLIWHLISAFLFRMSAKASLWVGCGLLFCVMRSVDE